MWPGRQFHIRHVRCQPYPDVQTGDPEGSRMSDRPDNATVVGRRDERLVVQYRRELRAQVFVDPCLRRTIFLRRRYSRPSGSGQSLDPVEPPLVS